MNDIEDDEDIYIMTVDDDVLENKFSEDEKTQNVNHIEVQEAQILMHDTHSKEDLSKNETFKMNNQDQNSQIIHQESPLPSYHTNNTFNQFQIHTQTTVQNNKSHINILVNNANSPFFVKDNGRIMNQESAGFISDNKSFKSVETYKHQTFQQSKQQNLKQGKADYEYIEGPLDQNQEQLYNFIEENEENSAPTIINQQIFQEKIKGYGNVGDFQDFQSLYKITHHREATHDEQIAGQNQDFQRDFDNFDFTVNQQPQNQSLHYQEKNNGTSNFRSLQQNQEQVEHFKQNSDVVSRQNKSKERLQLVQTPSILGKVQRIKLTSNLNQKRSLTNNRYGIKSVHNQSYLNQSLKNTSTLTKPSTNMESLKSEFIPRDSQKYNSSTSIKLMKNSNNQRIFVDIKNSLKQNRITIDSNQFNINPNYSQNSTVQMPQSIIRQSPNLSSNLVSPQRRIQSNEQRSLTPQQLDSEAKRLRQKHYFQDFVKPLHIKQQFIQKQKLQEYKKTYSINRASQQKMRRSSQDDAKLRSSQQSLDDNSLLDYQNLHNLEQKVRKMNISDYYKGNKLRLKSALGLSKHSLKLQNDSQSNNNFLQEIKDLTKNLAYCRPEEIVPVILNTDQQRLKQDLIDQEKAIIVMKNLKEQDGEDPNTPKEDGNVLGNFQGSTILFRNDMKTENKVKEHMKRQQWNSFIKYIKERPEKILQMVPSSNKTLEHSNEKLVEQHQNKRPISRFQTLGSQYLAALDISRPHSSNQAGLLNYSGVLFKRPGSRQINTAVHGKRLGKQGGNQSSLSQTAMSFNLMKIGLKSHHQSTGRVNMHSQLSKNRYNKIARSRPSHISTQYTNFLQQEDNRVYPQNNQSSIFSNQDSLLIIQQNNIQGSRSNYERNEQSFRLNKSQERLDDVLHIPIIMSNEFENRPKTSMNNQPKAFMLLQDKGNRKGNLLSSVKFPEKDVSPLFKIQQGLNQVQDLSQVDTSVLSIQEKAKRKISLYERANKKLEEIQKRLLRKKWHGYSLANDLAFKLKIDEWKQNPNFNKFQRQIDKNGPLRQANLIDWKLSKIQTYVNMKKLDFNQDIDEKFFKQDEVEYMINLFKYSSKSFSNIEQLKPVFNKSLVTLERIMDELSIGYLYDRISMKIVDISPDNTMKILLRCRMMFSYRSQIVNILQIIDIRETKLKELNYLVIKGDQVQAYQDVNASQSSFKTHITKSQNDQTKQTTKSVAMRSQKNTSTIKSSMENIKLQPKSNPSNNNFTQLLKMRSSLMQKEEREDLIKEKVKELSDITDLFVSKVRDLIQIKRIFGNVFIYDGMDYIKVVINEMKQLKQILLMFGIEIPLTSRSSNRITEQRSDLEEVSQINAGSFMLNNPLINLTHDQHRKSLNNSSLAKAMNAKGYNSIFEDLGSKETTIKIDNYSSIIQNNDSMMVGDINTGKNQQNNNQGSQLSYFGDIANNSPFKSKYNSDNTTINQ
eukprot:403355663